MTLTQAAPTGGAAVTLTNTNTVLTVAASMTVAAGATTGTFNATTTTIASNQSATVTATYNNSSANATVSLVAPVLVSSLACNPTSLGQNASSTCTVTLSQPMPSNGTWSNRQQITINHAQVSGSSNLSNFPVLISITDANLVSAAKADGSDIMFTASDGVTQLNHELEQYNSATGQLTAWVNVPSVSPSADTPIYMYYGNPATTSQQNPPGVWINNYLGVWHLPNGTTLTANDSTSHAFNGTITGFSAAVGEIYGGAAAQSTTSEIVTSANGALGNLAGMTASAWIHPNSSGGAAYGRIMDKSAGVGPVNGWYFGMDGSNLEFQVTYGTTNLLVTGSRPLTMGSTAYATVTWDGSGSAANAHLYVNGTEVSSYAVRQNASGTRNDDSTHPLILGNVNGVGDRHFDGWLDEARIANSVRSPDWILTEYQNQNAPTQFLTVGPQESITGSSPGGGTGGTVTLTTTNPALTVPTAVTVSPGVTTATFTATTGAVTSGQTATVTALFNGSSANVNLNLMASVLVSSLACNPTSLGQNASSTCTVTLTQAAPTGGAAVTLTNTNTVLTVPASVTVAAGATTATFSATTTTIASNQSATVTATYNSSSANATISLVAPVTVSSLACNPTSLGQNASSTCTVTLTQAAPTGGAAVTLTNTNTVLTVPASVTVAAGATTATFSATTKTIASNQSATVTATYNSSSANATISLVAPVTVSSLACNPTSLGQNASSTCTVTLTQAAPTGGAAVTLTDTQRGSDGAGLGDGSGGSDHGDVQRHHDHHLRATRARPLRRLTTAVRPMPRSAWWRR